MKKNKDLYYDTDFTPAIGCYYISILLNDIAINRVPFYNLFLVFPLFNDEIFLDYINKRKKTESFSQLLDDFLTTNKSNEFWIEYSLRFESSRRLCFESIYLGIIMKSFDIDEGGLVLTRNITTHIEIDNVKKNKAIKKLGRLTCNLPLQDIIRIMKVGIYND